MVLNTIFHRYQFGEAGGEYACYDESGNKLGATTLMKVGNHTITCTAKGYTLVYQQQFLKILQLNIVKIVLFADGWITLDLLILQSYK